VSEDEDYTDAETLLALLACDLAPLLKDFDGSMANADQRWFKKDFDEMEVALVDLVRDGYKVQDVIQWWLNRARWAIKEGPDVLLRNLLDRETDKIEARLQKEYDAKLQAEIDRRFGSWQGKAGKRMIKV